MKVLCVAVLMCVLAPLAIAQGWRGGPRLFSYQGEIIEKTGVKFPDGQYKVLIELWDGASGSAELYTETQTVNFHNGIFDIVIGSLNANTNELPESLTFDKPYWLGVTLDPGGANETKFPRQPILSAPYALNAERINGIDVSVLPVDGKIFPIPMKNGKIDPSFLPPTPASIQSINTVGPDNNGQLSIQASGSITVTNDAANHTITVSNPITSPGTSGTMIAVGTTAQRPPAPIQGMIRFNTTTNKFEGFDGTNWVDLN